ncbi:hypothetical protein K438DRAFT_2029550 [Mycena galopus ATCC 62051]|nr:hypothetical protein K438DRAFT_2029550 [Mycena galopus ATCC 62051]
MSSCYIDLEILHARNLRAGQTWLHKLPKPYAKVRLQSITVETSTAPRTRDPVWNHKFILGLSSPPNNELSLSISVMTSSFPVDRCLGTINATVHLIDSAESQHVLSLEVPGRTGIPAGEIVFRIRLQTLLLAGSASIDIVNAALQSSSVPRFTDIAQSDTFLAGGAVFQTDLPPLLPAIQALSQKLSSLMVLLDHLSRVHPYVELAWSVTSSLFKAIQGQLERDQKMASLVAVMNEIYGLVETLDTSSEKVKLVEDTLLAIAKQTIECTLFVREYCHQGFQGRTLHQIFIDPTDKIQHFLEAFESLRKSLDTAINIQTTLISMKVNHNMELLNRNLMLEKLKPADVDFVDRGQCLTGTRSEILGFISEWLLTPSDWTILWLGGLAGSGKSAVSATVANRIAGLRRLGAFICFDRRASMQQMNVVRNLSYQLGSFDSRLGAAISDGLLTNGRILTSPLPEQFQELILKPLLSQHLDTEGPIVVILDALDESGDGTSRAPLLDLLINDFVKLPKFVRVLVTSRPEIDIKSAFLTSPAILQHVLETDTDSNYGDIARYFRAQSKMIVSKNPLLELPVDWPGQDRISALCKKSSGLFAWCVTAMKFVETGQDPEERLAIVLDDASRPLVDSALYSLYELALQESGLWLDDKFIKDFTWWMGLVLLVWQPLPCQVINEFKETPNQITCLHTLRRFECLLDIEESEPIRGLHPSLTDFLTSPKHCGDKPWFIDAADIHSRLAARCFSIMERSLRFNISGSTSSYLENIHMPLNSSLSPALAYSCRFWADHLQVATSKSPGYGGFRQYLKTFLHANFLFWLEALSVLNEVHVSLSAVSIAEGYLKEHDERDLASFAADGLRFISTFFEPISESAPHIYTSALPFSPNDSLIRNQYKSQFPNTFSIVQGEQATWPPILNVFKAHHGAVGAVVVMPNGKHIASASADQTILILDLISGKAIFEPLRGHTGAVWALAVSPDGSRLVSGSSDQSLIIWDPTRGTQILPPCKGHNGGIWSASFSPDGYLIASGSDDRTIRTWDSKTSKPMCAPFEGHSGAVWSVEFSDDGARVVSGSADKDIRVWTTQGDPLFVLQGHQADVWSVAWSGPYILSGSGDQNIRLWDAHDGSLVLGPLSGHEGAIWAVCFSVDGHCFATGSADKTLRVWDIATGRTTHGPFIGHDGGIWSVSFSKDSKRIVSGSADGSIRIWDAKSEMLPDIPVFDSEVWSVSFLDNDRVSSGSSDKHVREWNAKTGQLLASAIDDNWAGRFTPGKQASVPISDCDNQPWVVALSPDSRYRVTGSNSGLLSIWNQETNSLLHEPIKAHHAVIWSLVFSSDGTYIASASADRTICLWETKTGAAVGSPLRGHTGEVWSVDFSPDASLLVSGSADRTIRLWDISNLNNLGTWTEQVGGWIKGPNEELLLWVPPYSREGLLWPGTVLGIGKHITKLDLTNFIVGIDWTKTAA